jgi:hypothetical protein
MNKIKQHDVMIIITKDFIAAYCNKSHHIITNHNIAERRQREKRRIVSGMDRR